MKKTQAFVMFALLSIMLGSGSGIAASTSDDANFKKAVSLERKLAILKKAAEAGDPEAQASLASMYAKGEGAQKDTAEAIVWYQKAALHNNAEAQYQLGLMMLIGRDIPKDEAQSIELIRKAADQGHLQATLSLGGAYEKGIGVPRDIDKAFEFYQLAAERANNPESYFQIGFRYYMGDGVPKDLVKASAYFLKAAGKGHADSEFFLGSIYKKGEGVPKDSNKAFEWFLKAAVQNDFVSQYEIGRMYLEGDGVPRNAILAYAWLNLAAARNNTAAIELRDRLDAQMASGDIAKAQRLASNWKKGEVLHSPTEPISSSNNNRPTPKKSGTGTAFIVSHDGHALTNQHVINGCKEIRIAGRNEIAEVVTSDSVNDLSLLKLPGSSPNAALLNSEPIQLRQGADVLVFGYPLNSVLSTGGNATPGIVSALTGMGNNTSQIQITAPIQPGSSGSPVIDKKGYVVGVVSMKLSDLATAKATGSLPQNVNFAVNGQTTKAFLDAHKVPYKTGIGSMSSEKSNADIVDEAKKWTVIVECWK